MLLTVLRKRLKANLTLNLSKREKLLACLFVIMLLLFLYYREVYTAQMEEINQLSAELASRREVLDEYRAREYDNVAALLKEKKEIQAKLAGLHMQVPAYLGEASILVDMYHLVRENNLYSDKIVFEKYQQENGFGRLPVSLTVEGLLIDVYRFLEQLENHHRQVRVAAVEFTPAGGKWITCSITAEFYVLGTPGREPETYPFMTGKFGTLPAYNVFMPPPGGETAGGYNNGNINSGQGTGYPVKSSEHKSDGIDDPVLPAGAPRDFYLK